MSFRRENVVPWGRSFDEYVAMLALSGADPQRRILGCGDGPASFNAELTRQGGQVVSVDPLHGLAAEDIRGRIRETYASVMEQTRKNMHEFIWTSIKTADDLGRLRMSAMEEFLSDYPRGMEQGSYVEGELPRLAFTDGEFDLAVCSHFLFLYSEQLSEDFHVASIRELCRVAGEARIFPLLELGARAFRHLQAVTAGVTEEGHDVTIIPVPYEFQRGGNQMMKVRGAGPESARDGLPYGDCQNVGVCHQHEYQALPPHTTGIATVGRMSAQTMIHQLWRIATSDPSALSAPSE